MMGPTHRLFGALAGAGAATITGHSTPEVVMTALVATATAHGWSSPDVDQTEAWRAIARLAPGRAAGLFKHRGVTHWWGLPLLAWGSAAPQPVTCAGRCWH